MAEKVSFPAPFLGMCGECLQSKTFATERERDLWQIHHTHDQGTAQHE